MKLSLLKNYILSLLIFIPCSLLVTDLLISSKKPDYPHLARDLSKEALQSTIAWHLDKNIGAIVENFDSCLVNISENQILCNTQDFFSVETAKMKEALSALKNSKELASTTWAAAGISEKEFYMSLFKYKIESIGEIQERQSVLGKIYDVEVTLKPNGLSAVSKLLGVEASKKINIEDQEKIVTVAFREHTYGYYVPVKPLASIFR